MKNESVILIPTKNSGITLEEVMQGITAFDSGYQDYLFIDNRSSDGSPNLVSQYIKKYKPSMGNRISIEKNNADIGYGGSVKKGIKFAIENGYQWIWIIHSDNQTDWQAVLGEIDYYVKKNEFDVILGSRFMNTELTKDYSHTRLWGNKLFNLITYLSSGYYMSDPGAAIGAFRTKIFQDIPVSKLHDGYRFHPELNLLIVSKDIEIKSFPLQWKDSTSKSNLKLITYGSGLLKFLVKIFFYRIKNHGNLNLATLELLIKRSENHDALQAQDSNK